jgi:engulfment and cell motility protein 1
MQRLTIAPVDLSIVSSVVSNVFASPPSSASSAALDKSALNGEKKPVVPLKDTAASKHKRNASKSNTSTKITIHGIEPASGTGSPQSKNPGPTKEKPLLQLYPQTHTLASEWLDGLLMLLNQKPITAETTKLVKLIGSYGLKIRLLNIRYEDLNSDDIGATTREGLDDDYWYDFGGIMTEAA